MDELDLPPLLLQPALPSLILVVPLRSPGNVIHSAQRVDAQIDEIGGIIEQKWCDSESELDDDMELPIEYGMENSRESMQPEHS
jgi:hypothetical protein